jgi:hypothetical protein
MWVGMRIQIGDGHGNPLTFLVDAQHHKLTGFCLLGDQWNAQLKQVYFRSQLGELKYLVQSVLP